MKIDTSKITGYAEMTAEDKFKALEEYENQEGEATDAPEVTDAPTPTVNVEDNEMPDVYGPPEDF